MGKCGEWKKAQDGVCGNKVIKVVEYCRDSAKKLSLEIGSAPFFQRSSKWAELISAAHFFSAEFTITKYIYIYKLTWYRYTVTKCGRGFAMRLL